MNSFNGPTKKFPECRWFTAPFAISYVDGYVDKFRITDRILEDYFLVLFKCYYYAGSYNKDVVVCGNSYFRRRFGSVINMPSRGYFYIWFVYQWKKTISVM